MPAAQPLASLALDILKDANDIVGVVSDLADTLFSEQRMEDYKRMIKKGKNLGNKTSHLVSSSERSARASIDSLVDAKNKITEILNNIKPDVDAIENADLLGENLAKLGKSLEAVKNSIASIAKIIENEENTVSLALDKDKNGALRREMLKVADDATSLMEKVKKSGFDLNVTIWK